MQSSSYSPLKRKQSRHSNNSGNDCQTFTIIALSVLAGLLAIALITVSVIFANTKHGSVDVASASVSEQSVPTGLPNDPRCMPSTASTYPARPLDGTCTTGLQTYSGGSVSTATIENVEGTEQFIAAAKGPNERVLSNLFFKGPAEIKNRANVSLWFTFFAEIEDLYMHAPVEETLSGMSQAQLYATGNPLSVFDYACLSLVNTVGGALVDPTDPFSPISNPQITVPYLLSCDARHLSNSGCVNNACFCTKSDHTPAIDLDNIVYPHDTYRMNQSRSFVDGKLKMSQLATGEEIPPTFAQTGHPIPFNGLGLFAPPPDPSTTPDIAGTLGGLSMNVLVTTTLLYREHNRLAAQLKQQNPSWSDEQLFQRARAWNIAQWQAIYAYEWLRVALGPLYESLFGSQYIANQPTVSPTIPIAFDSAMRSIHSTLYEDIDIVMPGPLEVGSIPEILAVANPTGPVDLLNTVFGGSVDPVVRSWVVSPGNEMDSIYIESLRTLLPPGSPAPALDLAASDIHRGRMDHAAPYYYARKYWRGDDLYTKLGCTPQTPQDPLLCFLAITSNATVAVTLQNVYKKIDQIDLHVGAMLEDRTNGVFLPTTYAYVVGKTLQKVRASDAFWFENRAAPFRQFSDSEISTIRSTRLFDIISRNTHLTCPFPAGQNSFLVAPEYPC